jgi:glycosyltransferase involved in cell wall biosynthesis
MTQDFSDRTIWIDSTGILRWGPQPMTGIQRVELNLCAYALAHPDQCGLCALDAATGRFQPLDAATIDYLAFIVRHQTHGHDHLSKRDRLTHLPAQLLYADNESARRLAMTFTRARARKGPLYSITKTAIRLTIWGYAGLRAAKSLVQRLAALETAKSRQAENGRKPLLLVSHEINRSFLIGRFVEAAGLREVDIVYDLIPVLMPDLVGSRFSENLRQFFTRVFRAQIPLITISNAVRDELEAWGRTELGLTSFGHISVCPLTGILPAATVTEPISELEGRRFAMFCSTFDIRKGQWLLVAAWKRLVEMLPADQLPDLVLIGRTNTGWEDARRELETAGQIARSKIHIFHSLADPGLNWAYENADFALFPSRAEGWGLGISEALHHGLPVVHSDLPILHEAAQHLMPSATTWNVDDWTAVLFDLLTTPGRLEELRDKIRTDYQVGGPEDFPKCVIARLRIEQQRS